MKGGRGAKACPSLYLYLLPQISAHVQGSPTFGKLCTSEFLKWNYDTACQCKLWPCSVLGELSICKTLVLLTKKGEHKRVFHNLQSQRKSHLAWWWQQLRHMATWSVLIRSGGSRSAYTSYNNIATLCNLIRETRSLSSGFQ